mgnify:CR=1 FL=1
MLRQRCTQGPRSGIGERLDRWIRLHGVAARLLHPAHGALGTLQHLVDPLAPADERDTDARRLHELPEARRDRILDGHPDLVRHADRTAQMVDPPQDDEELVTIQS